MCPEALDLGPLNGLVYYRLLTSRPLTWRWMLLRSAAEMALITAGIVTGGRFRSFIFLACCPSLAVFAVVFLSHGLSLAWTTGWDCPGVQRDEVGGRAAGRSAPGGERPGGGNDHYLRGIPHAAEQGEQEQADQGGG